MSKKRTIVPPRKIVGRTRKAVPARRAVAARPRAAPVRVPVPAKGEKPRAPKKLVEAPAKVTLGDLMRGMVDDIQVVDKSAERQRKFDIALNLAKAIVCHMSFVLRKQDVSDLIDAYFVAIKAACRLDPKSRKKEALMKECGLDRFLIKRAATAYYLTMTATPGDIPFEPRQPLGNRKDAVEETVDVRACVCASLKNHNSKARLLSGEMETSKVGVNVRWKSSRQVEVVRFNKVKSNFPEPNEPIEQVSTGTSNKVDTSSKMKIIYPTGRMYGNSPTFVGESDRMHKQPSFRIFDFVGRITEQTRMLVIAHENGDVSGFAFVDTGVLVVDLPAELGERCESAQVNQATLAPQAIA